MVAARMLTLWELFGLLVGLEIIGKVTGLSDWLERCGRSMAKRLPWARIDSQPAPSVIVHLSDGGQSIEGVQLRRDAAGVLLGAPKMLGEGADRDVPLAGEVWVPARNIRMVQEAK